MIAVVDLADGMRVVLVRDGQRRPGRIVGTPGNTHAYVRLDSGTSCSFPRGELEPELLVDAMVVPAGDGWQEWAEGDIDLPW